MAIVSFSHGFISVKNLKVAGTTLEVHLAQSCAEGDIVTPILPENTQHRPRNYEEPAGVIRFYNHMPASEIRERLPNEFGRFYRFCFERHPIDKCLSHFAMLLNSPLHRSANNPRTWDEYLERGDFPIDTARYTDDGGNLIVDNIYRYEEMAWAITDIAAKTGIPNRTLVAREKSTLRYNVPTLATVRASQCQREIIFDAFESSLQFVDYC